jgi:hypothetical protein
MLLRLLPPKPRANHMPSPLLPTLSVFLFGRLLISEIPLTALFLITFHERISTGIENTLVIICTIYDTQRA